ncbi:hypothetical protein L596_023454 [Steinernema carpocapsae]|uniref:Uncharacterized protein n=1 Tax=Steinernema carpocapsae TaxID=34508 RepID=A0A4U5MDN9_STECR|nr:hypothetical protein L596_023454 [Steinernema carpocapsae]
MPDLIDTLIKYTANNLEGKTAEQMAMWLDILLKKDEKKKEAKDEDEAREAPPRSARGLMTLRFLAVGFRIF